MSFIKYHLDPKNPPKPKRDDLKRFDDLREEDIDYSDIPELDEDFWARAVLTPPRIKPSISLRVPPDVLDFFKAGNAKGYTARMVAVLKAYVKAQKAARTADEKK